MQNAKEVKLVHKIPQLEKNEKETKKMCQRNFLEVLGMQFVQTFLRDVGLSLNNSCKVVNGKRMYDYTVNEMKLNHINTTLKKRLKESTGDCVKAHEHRVDKNITVSEDTIYSINEGVLHVNCSYNEIEEEITRRIEVWSIKT